MWFHPSGPTGKRFVAEYADRVPDIWERVLHKLTGNWPLPLNDGQIKFREVSPDSPEYETAPYEEYR